MNAVAVAAMTAAMIFMIQGPLTENATPRMIQAMSIALVAVGAFTFWATRFARPAKAAAVYLVIIACTGLHMKFRVRDYLDTSIDFVIVLQGLIYVAYIGIASLALLDRRAHVKKPALIGLGILVVACLLSIINAPNPQYSAASTVALLATVFFAFYCAMNIPTTDLAGTLALATAPVIVLSFVVLMFPGHPADGLWVHRAGPASRLQGVANNPIGLALFCGHLIIALTAKVLFAERREPMWIVAACVLIPVTLVCLFNSGSRGPSLGLFAGVILGSILALRPFGRATLPIFFAAFALMLPLAYFTVTEAVSNESLSALARSGQAEEVATFTGRTNIWAYTLTLIPQHFFLGHGIGSPLQLYADVNIDVGGDIVEAHNLFLHSALMIGVPGALALMWLLLFSASQAYARRNGFALMLLIFFLVTGISENFAFSNRPGWHTLVLFAIILSVARQRQARQSGKPRSTHAQAANTPG